MDNDVRVRVRFTTRDAALQLPPHLADAPLAVPVQLNRKGLSEVVHHLRGNPAGEEPRYDFAIEDQLLRCSLDKFLQATGVSTETTVTVEYFRSLQAPTEGPKTAKADTWIGSIVGCGPSSVVAGGYDGVLRRLGAADCGSLESWQAHEGPIKAVAAFPTSSGGGGAATVVTAGKDHVLKAWRLATGVGASSSQAPRATLVGHENSVEAVAVRGRQQVLSGDWGGMLFFWKVEEEEEADGDDGALAAAKTPAKKKRKGAGGGAAQEAVPVAGGKELSPVTRLKAHAHCVSGIEWDPAAEEKAFTASWDHAVKVWDLERQDCIQTLNGSKVVTALAAAPPSTGRVLAAGHPDGRVRLWDLRAPAAAGPEAAEGAEPQAAPERRALAPCGSWLSGVAWLPGREGALASVSHDGQLRVWDLRASKPLFTVAAHEGKALALCAAGEGEDAAALFTGGADGVVRRFELP